MTLQELTAKIRQIEIKSRNLSNHIFAGDYHSAFKGRGMSFSEVREYSYGDDVRFIDWNVSARLGHPYIKVFEEEREITMMLLIDISASSLFGTHQKTKRDLITELAGTLAYSALKNNDKVGALFFSNGIDKYIPAKKGKSHILYILRTLLTIQAKENTNTQINIALQTLLSIVKRKSIAIILSDFISTNFEKELKLCAQKHDIVGIHVYDYTDKQLPSVGLLPLQDIEQRQVQWVNTNDQQWLKAYQQQFESNTQKLLLQFQKLKAGCLSIATHEDYVKLLHQYFSNR